MAASEFGDWVLMVLLLHALFYSSPLFSMM
jgi:hypothetical protein